MRLFLLTIILTAFFPKLSMASIISHNIATLYYKGEAITIMGAGGTSTRHPYLLARTLNPMLSRVDETVITYQQGKFKENSSALLINGSNFVLSESTGVVSGGGYLAGPPWEWTYLFAEFHIAKMNMRIVDYNLFAGPNTILGHKDFFRIDATGREVLFMQEDVVLHPVSVDEFQKLQKELLEL